MLEIDDFCKILTEEIKRTIGEKYIIQSNKVMKNTSCDYTAIVLFDAKGSVSQMAPTFYAENYYKEYIVGKTVQIIAREIVDYFLNDMIYPEQVDFSSITKNDIESKVFYRLINKSRNSVLLEDNPHIVFLDLVLTFHYLCE